MLSSVEVLLKNKWRAPMRSYLTAVIAVLVVSFSVAEWAESGDGCVYCHTNVLSGVFLCTSCSETSANCFQFLTSVSYVCCSPNISNKPCSAAAIDPDALTYTYVTATGECDPREVCATCPTNICVHFDGGDGSCDITGDQVLPGPKGKYICF